MGGQTGIGIDQLFFPSVPEIHRITGCPESEDQGTSLCPTTGGIPLTIYGEYFSGGMQVTVNREACELLTWADDYLTCELPAGTGLSVAVIVEVIISAEEVRSSIEYFLVGYAPPSLATIVHNNCTSNDPAVLQNCPREGGQRLTITGVNLGNSDAFVLVGSRQCTDVIHVSASTEVTCVLPSGTLINAPVIFIQDGGSLAPVGNMSVGYTQCPEGTFQDGTAIDCNAPSKTSALLTLYAHS